MESEVHHRLQNSQETGLYHEPDKYNPNLPTLRL